MSTPGGRHAELDLVALAVAAQRAAGVLAAWDRGDPDGVAALMGGFPEDQAFAGGALLLARLSLGLYGDATQQTMEQSIQDLTVRLACVAEKLAGR